MRFANVSMIVSALFALCFATAAKADVAPARTVATEGEAVIFVTPDEVVVNFGVENFDENLDKAKSANDELSAKLLKALKAVGVDDKCIQTDTLRIALEYKDNRPWQGLRGYTTHRTYVVTLKDIKLFDKVVDAALKNGANQLDGFEFRTTELRKYRDQARSLAVKAAKEKAVALAKDLECGVGKPWQISEISNGYFGRTAGNYFQNAAQAVPDNGGDNESTLPLGQIAIRASVNVVFDLTDK